MATLPIPNAVSPAPLRTARRFAPPRPPPPGRLPPGLPCGNVDSVTPRPPCSSPAQPRTSHAARQGIPSFLGGPSTKALVGASRLGAAPHPCLPRDDPPRLPPCRTRPLV